MNELGRFEIPIGDRGFTRALPRGSRILSIVDYNSVPYLVYIQDNAEGAISVRFHVIYDGDEFGDGFRGWPYIGQFQSGVNKGHLFCEAY